MADIVRNYSKRLSSRFRWLRQTETLPAGHPACREEPARGAPPGRSRPPARRRLSLSSRRHPTRSGQPRQVSGAAQARSRTRLAPYAQWPTVCSTSPAPCSETASASTRIVPGPPPRGRRDARSGGRVCRSTVTAASTGHPVIARASLNEVEENTTTARATWWRVLFILPIPRSGLQRRRRRRDRVRSWESRAASRDHGRHVSGSTLTGEPPDPGVTEPAHGEGS